MTDIDKRKIELIERYLKNHSNDIYGSESVLKLSLGIDVASEEKRLQYVAEWFEHPHPRGRDVRLEADFVALRLVRAAMLESISAVTREKIKQFFLKNDFCSMYASENHIFIFHVSRYLVAQLYKNELFKAYGKTGEQLAEEEEAYLRNFIIFRAKRGWAEFDSTVYMIEIIACLINLYDFAKSSRLKKISHMMLDILMADMLEDSSNGVYGGAHGRIYEHAAFDFASTPLCSVYYLYFGHSHLLNSEANIEMLLSDYAPSDFIYELLEKRIYPHENYESKHLHSINDERPQKQVEQVDGSINKYTYIEKDYILGAVNFQDSYPADSEAKWYAQHEQHNWELSFTEDTSQKIFTHHPGAKGAEGHEHGFWTGDLGCLCGNFFCVKNILLALYDIQGEKEEKMIHTYLSRKDYDKIQEIRNYIFLKKNNVLVSLFFSNGYKFRTDGKYADKEVLSFGAKHAVICEVGRGDFEKFIENTLSEKIEFDIENMSLRYKNLFISKTERKINNTLVEFPYPTYSSLNVKSDFGSGVIIINDRKLDFNNV